jgi:hypothetical protein
MRSNLCAVISMTRDRVIQLAALADADADFSATDQLWNTELSERGFVPYKLMAGEIVSRHIR